VKLEDATNYFRTVAADGWDGDGWSLEVIQGDFYTYDRFISDRSFGQKKRIFTTGTEAIPSQYQALRLAGGRRYLIASENVDYDDARAYNHIYQLEEAPFTAHIIEWETTLLASGIQGKASEKVLALTYCDLERVTARGSSVADAVTYAVYEVILPRGVLGLLNADRALRINNVYYDVHEVSPELRLTYVRALKRGP
jgi:hypothetical protein